MVDAIRDTDVPVADVIWSGEDERWFGSPYFIVNKFEGDVLRNEWGQSLSYEQMQPVAAQAMRALASLHLLDWREYVPDDGPPLELEPDVTRWGPLLRALRRYGPRRTRPAVRRSCWNGCRRCPASASSRRLPVVERPLQLRRVAAGGHRLELWGVGATLNDIGWVITFADGCGVEGRAAAEAAEPGRPHRGVRRHLRQRSGRHRLVPRAGRYKFAIISGFNLYLHRTGKRPDESWEDTALSAPFLMRRALELLNGG